MNRRAMDSNVLFNLNTSNHREGTMKRFFFLLIPVAVIFSVASVARAQDHVELGAFANYFRLDATHTNFAGLGGRFAINATLSA